MFAYISVALTVLLAIPLWAIPIQFGLRAIAVVPSALLANTGMEPLCPVLTARVERNELCYTHYVYIDYVYKDTISLPLFMA